MWNNNKIKFYSFALFLISLFLLLAASSLVFAKNGQQPQSQETLEMEIKLGRGLNMVSFPFEKAYILFNESDCYFLFNLAGKLKDPTKSTFRDRYETYNLKEKKYKLGGIPLVIYSFEECTLKVKGSGRLTANEINKREDLVNLRKGLNHIPIPYGGIKLTQIGGCEIKSVRYYNSSEQDYKWYRWVPSGNKAKFFKSKDARTWVEISTLEADKYYLPHGISVFINVRENCKLRFSEESTETARTTTTTTQQTTGQIQLEECPKKNEWNLCSKRRLLDFRDGKNKKIIIHNCNATQLGMQFGSYYKSHLHFEVSAPNDKKCKLEWRVEAIPKEIDEKDIAIYANWTTCPSISYDEQRFGKKTDSAIVAELINETFSGTSYVLVSVDSHRTVPKDTIFNVSVSITNCRPR
jgi:hypothetical protein